MDAQAYWKECISEAAEECGLKLTQGQLDCLASGAQAGHEHYGMAFYSPPSSDRIREIERDDADRLKRLQSEYDEYRNNAETAMKRALRQHRDAHVAIGEHGEVTRHGGRMEIIQ